MMSQQAVDVVFSMPNTAYYDPAIAEQQRAWLHSTRIRLRSISFRPAGRGRPSLAMERAEEESEEAGVGEEATEPARCAANWGEEGGER